MSSARNEPSGKQETTGTGRRGRLRLVALASLGAAALLVGACTEYGHHRRPQVYYAPGYYYSAPPKHHHHQHRHRDGHGRYDDDRRGWR